MKRAILAALLLAGGCRPPAPEYPGALVDSGALAPRCLVRQKVIAIGRNGTHRFDAVLQVDRGALVLLGLTPFSAKAFAIEQRGGEVRFVPHLVDRLPFPPRHMILDIQRAYFQGLGLSEPADGRHERTLGAEIVSETWSSGALVERSFRRHDGKPRGAVRIRYVGGWKPGAPLPSIVLENEWLAYRLEVTTLHYRQL